MKRFCLLFIVVVSVMITSVAMADDADLNWVGGKAIEEFENNWRTPLYGCYSIVGGFVNTMNSYNDSVRKFYTTLIYPDHFYGGTDGGTSGVDSVDVFIVCTHGGAWRNPSLFTQTMYNYETRATSDFMRMGDNGRRLSIYSTFSCETMSSYTNSWSDMEERWLDVFQGGLRIATGFWGKEYPGYSTGAGTKYAQELHSANKTILDAWMDAADDYSANTPKVMATGNDLGRVVCASRLVYMKLSNYRNYTRLSDSDNLYLCTHAISETAN
ncbi:MAG: hypothetical protein IJM59_07005 [Proteobacteria bacterium]|nr:hypothetical protein [Pseudomonadota bacterium]